MAYERVNWENLPSTKTPVNADNLNKMDKGIKDLETELSKKANSADVYTKTEITNNLLPMTGMVGSNVGDSSTITIPIDKSKPYIFINSHVFNREIVMITMYQSTINTDRLINTVSTDLSSFTLNGNKLTIKGAGRCRGKLYRLNYQITS